MKLLRATAANFQSYPGISFDYSGLGLALISGVTGSGKSTALDLPCWILFGTTSKDSAADDVRAWGSDDEQTIGSIEVETPQGSVTVTRIRAKGAHKNDLYWTEASAPGVPRRGKDALETQKLLETRLGVTADLYLAGAYMHQFSTAEQFFTAKAKDRRESLERIADLSLPVKIAERASEARKQAKKDLEARSQGLARANGKHEQLRAQLDDNHEAAGQWAASQQHKIDDLEARSERFESDKQAKLKKLAEEIACVERTIEPPAEIESQIDLLKRQVQAMIQVRAEIVPAQKQLAAANAAVNSLKAEYDRLADLGVAEAFCPTCLGPADNVHKAARIDELTAAMEDAVGKQIKAEEIVAAMEATLRGEAKIKRQFDELVLKRSSNNRLIDRAQASRQKYALVEAEQNTYEEQIERAKAEKNPFSAQRKAILDATKQITETIQSLTQEVRDLEHRVASLTTIYDASFELRGRLIENAVRELNDATNAYLEKYFDASLRVRLEVKDGDKIDVTVLNQGHECPYKQLSGGERTLLKLCFNLPYMAMAENRAGIRFGCLMFDEPLKGLSDQLKDRALALFQGMEADHETILLIEHYEPFTQMCGNRFHVTNLGGESRLERVDPV
jgi:DNA repair exonuclease SbcCD ATPase subunit